MSLTKKKALWFHFLHFQGSLKYKNQEGKERSAPHPGEAEQMAGTSQRGEIPMALLEVTRRAEAG